MLQSQEFTWTSAAGQNTPFFATVTFIMNTSSTTTASATPQGLAQASVTFTPVKSNGDSDFQNDQVFKKTAPPSIDDRQVPGTVSLSKQFSTSSRTDANLKIVYFVTAALPLRVIDQVAVQVASDRQTGTSTATAGVTSVSTADFVAK